MSDWLWSYAAMTIVLWAGMLTLIGLGAWINERRKARQFWAETDAMECGICQTYDCQGRCI